MTTDAGTSTPEPIEDVVARDLSGWAQFIYNCTTGDNYFRTQEHYDLIRDLDRYASSLTAAEAERDALRARVAGLEAGLRRVTLALPVLRDVLRAARLAGSDVAEDMLAEARALLAPSSEETK